MNRVRRVAPLTAWLLATLFLASLAYRTLGAQGAALAVLLLGVLAARWSAGHDEDPS